MRHGSELDPPNRFERVRLELDEGPPQDRHVEYVEDSARSIVAQNDSPDIPFRYSVNPYRGCAHGCAYCYARPTHEFIGFNAGLDFETKIVVKRDAPALLRDFLSKDSWKPEPIVFSGVTDCYQPAEQRFELTRGCLEVAAECKQPVSIITKNALVVRDLDLLAEMAKKDLVHVYLSITTLDSELARAMEPRTSVPDARLRALRSLTDAGVPAGVMIAPTIPGLNDSEIPAILEACKNAGATCAGYILLRLPLTVRPVFIEWLERAMPLQAERVLARIQETRGESLNSSAWGERMVGRGEIAEQIRALFHVARQQQKLDRALPAHNCDQFVPPSSPSGQLRLF